MNKKIKLIILICICALAIGILSGCAVREETYTEFSPQCEKVSELSDQGIIEFLRYYKAALPKEFVEAHTEAELAQVARGWIKSVEQYQKMPGAAYGHTALLNAFEAVCNAALKHYGWDAGE